MLRHLLITGLLFTLVPACGAGGNDDDDDDDDKRPVDYCYDSCEKTEDCGVSVEYVENCKDACLDAAQIARDAGCLNEFESAAKCNDSNFSCDGVVACDGPFEDYVSCTLE